MITCAVRESYIAS